MNSLQHIADRLWHIAEQLLEVEDQEIVADAIEDLSALSQKFQSEEFGPAYTPVPASFHPMESTFH